jgi:pentatricopeptide repeat protein
MDMYKELHTVCESGPNIDTFNILMQGAERKGTKNAAMFLASEMIALGIKPDFLTYDRLIMVCLHEDDYEDAFRYLEEMIDVGKDKFENGQKGWYMRKGTVVELVKKCVKSHDERAWDLLAEMDKRGIPNKMLKQWANQTWGIKNSNPEVLAAGSRSSEKVGQVAW